MEISEGAIVLREEENRLFGFEILKDLDVLHDYSSRGKLVALYSHVVEMKEKIRSQMCPEFCGDSLLELAFPELWEQQC